MSTTIDQRVVEMRFDNKHFENNVSTTMSTLDKLKQKLHLDGATKGLENVSSSAKKVDLSGINNSVESVSAKFSAMQVVAITALSNITNSAVNAGKRIVSALTIQPVTTGFNEYELKMGSIQTIMASTGESLDTVNRYLNELNEYSDKTIYSFSDMTTNIGKFTNAGVKLEDAVLAIKGISNEAAISGASAAEASRAMYNFSQALSAGYVKLIDWKSIENANMATVEFKQQLIDSAVAVGTLTKEADGMYKTLDGTVINATKNFNDSLQDQWMTTDVLIGTLRDYADETTEIGKKAMAAAQDVKTWTMLFDTLKEAAQSGWAQTWELIFGDFEEVKEFLSGTSKLLGGFIDGMSDYRNNLLGGVMDSSWDKLVTKISESGVELSAFEEKIKELYTNKKDLNHLIEQFGSLEKAIKAGKIPTGVLKKALADLGISGTKTTEKIAGFVESLDKIERMLRFGSVGDDVKILQTALEELGHSVGECKIDGIIGPDTRAAIMEFQKEAGITVDGIAGPETLEALRKAGTSLQEVADEAGEAKLEYDELIDSITRKGGRELFLEGLQNVFKSLIGIFKAMGSAWNEIFPANGIHNGLLKAIESFNNFSKAILVTSESLTSSGETVTKFNENGEKLVRVFKGAFAAIDALLMIIGGPVKIALKIVSEIIGAFDYSILDVAASIGDALVSFRDWLDSIFDVSGALDIIVPIVKDAISVFKNWFATFKASKGMQQAAEYINKLTTGIKDWWAGLKDSEDLPKTIAEGIVNFFSNIPSIISNILSNVKSAFEESFTGLGDGAFGTFVDNILSGMGLVGDVAVELGKILLEKLNKFLSARGFNEISIDAISGLVNGLKSGAADAWNAAVEIAKGLVQQIKDFLGIHSPSTVMAGVGENTVAGLVEGLTNGENNILKTIIDIGSKILETVKSVFGNIINWISQADFGTLFVGGMGVAALVVINKIANALSVFDGISDLLTGIGESIKDFGDSVKNLSKSAKTWAVSKVITSLAIAIGVLAASLFLLSFVEPAELWNAVGAITVLAGVMAGLAIVISKFGPKETADLGKYALALLGVAGSILILALAIKMLSSIENINQGGTALLAIVVMMGLLMKATQTIGKDVGKIGGTLIVMAGAMLIMVIVAKIAGEMDPYTLTQGCVALGVFMLLMVALMRATQVISGDNNVGAIGGTLFKIAAAMLIMVIVAKIAASMTIGEIVKGIAVLAAFAVLVRALMASTSVISDKDVAKIGTTLLGMAVVIAVMALAVTLLGALSLPHLAKGTIAVGVLSGMLALMIHSTKGATECKSNIIAMAIAIGVMAAAVVLLSFLPIPKLIAATLALSAVMGMFALIVKQSRNLQAAIGPLIVMTGAIAIIAGALYLLATMPVGSVLGSALALSGVLMALVGAMVIVSKMPKKINIGALVNLGAMIVAMYAIVGALALMQNVKNAESNAKVLGGLIIVLSAMCVVVAAAGAIISATGGMGILGLGMLLGLIVAMYAVVGALAIIQNVKNAEANAKVLGGLMTVLSVLCIIIAAAGVIIAATYGIALVGLAALFGVVGAMYAVIGVLVLMENIQNAEANATLLIGLMGVIGDLMVLLAVTGPLAIIGVTALTMLLGLIATLGVLAAAVGALVTKFPQLQEFLNTGIPILEQLAVGLGSIIGGFVAAFAGAVMSTLPLLGACLSAFMVNVQGFIAGAKSIDASVITGIGILSAAIIALTAADFINNILSFGGSGLASLGMELSAFMISVQPFIAGAKMITPEAMAGVKTLADTILILTGAGVLDGLASLLGGGSSLDSFASQLPLLGTGLANFASNIGTFSEEQLTTVQCAANAIKTLAQASSEIPNSGGLLGQLVGENDLSTFASQFPILGSGLANFLSNIGTFTDAQVATVTCAADAIKTLAQASDEIPNSGGLLADLVGDNDLATFASSFPLLGTALTSFLTNIGTFDDAQVATVDCAASAIKSLAEASSEIPNAGGLLAAIVGDNDLTTFANSFPILGTALASFLANIGTFDEAQVATVQCAANAIKTLAQASSEIPNAGGLLAAIVGDNDLATFSTQLPLLGEGMNGFVTKLGTFDEAQVTTVRSAISAIGAFTDLANADLKGAKKNLTDFGEDLPDFGEDMGEFCSSMPTADSMTTAMSNIDKLLAAVRNIAAANTGALATFADNLKKVGKDAVDKFLSAFTNSNIKSDLENAGKDLGDKVAKGIESKGDTVKEAGKELGVKAADGADNKYDAMKRAGKDLGDGLKEGIKAKKTEVYWAAYELGKEAVRGEKDGQQSNSPSKLTILAGKWLGEGLVIGMGKMASNVYNAGYDLGDTATSSISTTISKISDAINTDIDTQPTIRPVLDLSGVRSGASSINSLFNGGASVGLLANVNNINSSMNRRGQNGANGDVVSAIDKLSRKMDNISNTSYTINGVTYDDGSNVASAIETIVRAAVRERRI